MKKIIYVTAGAALMLSAASCSQGGSGASDEGRQPKVELEGYSYDAVALLPDSLRSEEEGGDYMRLTGQGMLPVAISGEPVDELRDSLEHLASVTMLSDGISTPRLPQGFSLTDVAPADTTACSTAFNELTVSLVSPQMVVWKNYAAGYLCGAAHGVYNTTFVNYSIEMGKILHISDVMNPGYEPELTHMLLEKLKEEKVEVIVDEDEVGIPADFQVTTDGINFIYGLYEIAPYAEGEVTVSFESYELEPLFRPGAKELLFGPTE